MKKIDFIRSAIEAGAHFEKSWVISIFSVIIAGGKDDVAWSVKYNNKDIQCLTDSADGLFWDVIEDAEPNQPLFDWTELVTLDSSFHQMFKSPTLTTWGTLIFNLWAIWYPLQDRWPYVNPDYKKDPRACLDIKQLNRQLVSVMKSDPADPADRDGVSIYVKDYLLVGRSLTRLTGFNSIFVPSGTPLSMTPHPEARKILQQRLEENKDRLHDPAIIAEIQNEQVRLDQEHLNNDPSLGFYLPGKVWHTARKRMFYIHGPESGLDEGATPELIVNSLRDGWDITKFSTMINSARAGSYYRGAMTALGGESVKFFLRVFQNVYVTDTDCGSGIGLEYTIDKDLIPGLIGRYEINDSGVHRLDLDNLQPRLGEKIYVRSAWACKDPDVCKICIGDRNSETPYALGSLAAGQGSTMMLVMMSAAHAKVLSVVELEEDFLT